MHVPILQHIYIDVPPWRRETSLFNLLVPFSYIGGVGAQNLHLPCRAFLILISEVFLLDLLDRSVVGDTNKDIARAGGSFVVRGGVPNLVETAFSVAMASGLYHELSFSINDDLGSLARRLALALVFLIVLR
jgi:hypothetical protein